MIQYPRGGRVKCQHNFDFLNPNKVNKPEKASLFMNVHVLYNMYYTCISPLLCALKCQDSSYSEKELHFSFLFQELYLSCVLNVYVR